MDLATQLGEQGFKWIMRGVDVHGSPLHIAALDEAGDFFRDTYGGRMVNLWGLLPVIGGWGSGIERHAGGVEERRRRLTARRRGRAFPDAASPAKSGRAGLPAGAVGHRLDLRRECRGSEAEGLAGLHRRAAPGKRGTRKPHLDVVDRRRAQDVARDSRRRGSREGSRGTRRSSATNPPYRRGSPRRASAIACSASNRQRGARSDRTTPKGTWPHSSWPSSRRGTPRIWATMPRHSTVCGLTTS